MARRLKILQHNVLHWDTRKYELYNTYRHIDPEIILLNSHGKKDEEKIILYGYTVHQINITGEGADGAAIAVKTNIKHKLLDQGLMESSLAIQMSTDHGSIIIATIYQPPRRNYLPRPDLQTILNHNQPTFIIGDLNANHRAFGSNYENRAGRQLKGMLDDNRIEHVGPFFTTFVGHQGASTPDTVLSKNTTANIYLERGPPTTSDHFPIITTISHSPIQIPIRTRLDLKKAKWNELQKELQNSTAPQLQDATTGEIEEELEKWYRDIKLAFAKYVPTTSYRTVPYTGQSDGIRLLNLMLDNVTLLADQRGWDRELRTRFTEIKRELAEEWKELKRIDWERQVILAEANNKDPKKFWRAINKLRGREGKSENCILNENDEKIYEPAEKERILREHWSNCFKITEEENLDYDQQHEAEINEKLMRIEDQITPLERADPSLLNSHFLLNKIYPREVKQTVKSFKNFKAPGPSGINKEMMEKLPNKMLLSLKYL